MQPSLPDFVVPKESNDYLPYLLRRTALLGMLGLVLLSFLLANLHALLWQSSSWLTGAVLPAVVVDLTNVERQAESLPSLTRSPILDAAAQLKAEDMAKNSYFSHYSPSGVSPWYWFGEANYHFVHAGENLAVHFSDSGEVVEAWMNSPTHKANIVNGNFREIGVGTAKGVYEGFDTVFVVQLFGTPAKPAPTDVVAQTEELPEIVVRPIATNEAVPTSSTLSAIAEIENEDAKETVAGAETEIVDDEVDLPLAENEESLPPAVEPALEPQTHDIANTAVEQDSISLYSTFISTSTNLEPLPILQPTDEVVRQSSLFGRAATSPHLVLQALYFALGIFVAGALFAAVIIEWRRQHPRQVLYGVLLLLLMSGLFYLQSLIIAGAVIG